MNKLDEVAKYVANWDLGQGVVTIRMSGEESVEKVIQALTAEMLRDFLKNPIPEGLKEGTQDLYNWIDACLRVAMNGMDFGLTTEEEDAAKNLAFNYYVEGVRKSQQSVKEKNRIYKCFRDTGTAH